MMSSNKIKSTSFRLSQTAINHLQDLKAQINKNTAVKITYTDIIELLIRRAKPDQIVKKINDL